MVQTDTVEKLGEPGFSFGVFVFEASAKTARGTNRERLPRFGVFELYRRRKRREIRLGPILDAHGD